MRRVKNPNPKQQPRVTFDMAKKEREEAYKKALAEKAKAEMLEKKRVSGLAHYKAKLEKSKQQGKWR
jgi:hypothetical protein